MWEMKPLSTGNVSLCHPRPERTRISCHAALTNDHACGFRKESRMKFASATKFNRKFGVA
jgi:hypothetical protein